MIVQTRNTKYTVDDLGNGEILISGDPKRCPEPTKALILAPIRVRRGMFYRPLEGPWHFEHGDSPTRIVATSTVMSITDDFATDKAA